MLKFSSSENFCFSGAGSGGRLRVVFMLGMFFAPVISTAQMERMYWNSGTESSILVADIDGSNSQNLITSFVNNTIDVEVAV